jgi:hypothetical protein
MEQNMKYKGFEQKVECSNSGTGTTATATAGSGTSGSSCSIGGLPFVSGFKVAGRQYHS